MGFSYCLVINDKILDFSIVQSKSKSNKKPAVRKENTLSIEVETNYLN